MRRSISHQLALAAAAALIGVVTMTACTATEHDPHPTASSVSTADWPVAASAAVGPTEIEVHKPNGARSLQVDFSCLGGGVFVVAINLDGDEYSGSCGGMQHFAFSTTGYDEGASVRINVQVHDDTHFVLRGTFSAEKFVPNAALKRQCETLGKVESVYANADAGYERKAIDDAQWAADVSKANRSLVAFDRSARKQTPSGMIAQLTPALVDWMTGDGDHPGGYRNAPLGDFTAARALIGQICSANGTPIVIHMKYGG
jgi:hypothetical protein